MIPFDPTVANRATVDVETTNAAAHQQLLGVTDCGCKRVGERAGGWPETVNLFFSRRTANCCNSCSRIAAAAVVAAAATAAERREKEEPDDHVPRQNA